MPNLKSWSYEDVYTYVNEVLEQNQISVPDYQLERVVADVQQEVLPVSTPDQYEAKIIEVANEYLGSQAEMM
ncbi:MAG: hypothetical protein BRC23_00300 [Parcubacteria group bacterium SW_4_49_11]|nr:MAG: hypothetical protein BRC23_00300 [Parcubacteria group bacterium SW_4_49_11]